MTRGRDHFRTATGQDPLTPAQRRHNMSLIRAMDTQPEMLVRRGLHSRGLRYRLHDGSLPGRPDIVLPNRHAVIQVNGCFWHGHDCPKGVTPGTNTAFWTDKIERNRARDNATTAALLDAGWRVLTVWECALRGRARQSPDAVIDESVAWLDSEVRICEITGRWADLPPKTD